MNECILACNCPILQAYLPLLPNRPDDWLIIHIFMRNFHARICPVPAWAMAGEWVWGGLLGSGACTYRARHGICILHLVHASCVPSGHATGHWQDGTMIAGDGRA